MATRRLHRGDPAGVSAQSVTARSDTWGGGERRGRGAQPPPLIDRRRGYGRLVVEELRPASQTATALIEVARC